MELHKTPIEAAFAAYMVRPTGRRGPKHFQPDYANPPRFGAGASDPTRAIITHYQGKPIGNDCPDKRRAGVMARARVCLHEASHVAAHIATGAHLFDVHIKGTTPDRVHGSINLTCHLSPSREAFDALAGHAMEEALGRVPHTAGESDHSFALAKVGDEFDAVADVAREFVAAARKPIRFIATWLLICSAANGIVGPRRLRAIARAAQADIQRIARELEIDKKLAAIDRRMDAAWQAQRRAAGHTPESVAAWIDEAFAPLDSAK